MNLLHCLLSRKKKEHDDHEDHCAALCCAHHGQCARVLGFDEKCLEAARLREMGVREGALVTVLRDGDPLMVRVDDARFGISRQAAMQIYCDFVNVGAQRPEPSA